MEWQSYYLPLHAPGYREADVTLRDIAIRILVSVLVSLLMLFAAGIAFDSGQVEQVREPAISSAIPGPLSYSCAHVRWCSKPVQRHYLFEYPLVSADGEGQSV